MSETVYHSEKYYPILHELCIIFLVILNKRYIKFTCFHCLLINAVYILINYISINTCTFNFDSKLRDLSFLLPYYLFIFGIIEKHQHEKVL